MTNYCCVNERENAHGSLGPVIMLYSKRHRQGIAILFSLVTPFHRLLFSDWPLGTHCGHAGFVYQNGMEQVGEQLVDFKGRAELVKDYITEGRVAVRIHSLRVSDNGMYKCFFKKGTDFEEAVLELKVIGE